MAMGDAHILWTLLTLHILWGSHGNRWNYNRDGFGDNHWINFAAVQINLNTEQSWTFKVEDVRTVWINYDLLGSL